jgi:type IV pilus assembly protein PilC
MEALIRKVKGAMTYPMVVFGVSMGATAFMLLFLIPRFAAMFSDFGGELPLPTKIVMGSPRSSAIPGSCSRSRIGLVVVPPLRGYRERTAHRGQAMLGVPILGTFSGKEPSPAREPWAPHLLGCPSSGLDITARTAGNKIIQEAIIATRGSIREGETIAAPLKQSKAFPPMVVQMIAVGEETGALDDMLNKIATFYDDEVNTAVETLTSIIEPVMIVVMGLLVGGMVVAMYMPMFARLRGGGWRQ